MRDLGALLALPAMWVDHDPGEIATGLLSVLSGVLQVTAAYVRFDESSLHDRPLECWRPSGPRPPPELLPALETHTPPAAGMTTAAGDGPATLRVTRLPLALPWETGLVLVCSDRPDFPTAMEAHLLRIAVGQAAIAIHTARRIAREQHARSAAEAALQRQNELLHALVDQAGPALAAAARRLEEASRLMAEADASGTGPTPGTAARRQATSPAGLPVDGAQGPPVAATPPLSRREAEVLGLLAQGLSNREIAALMWLSDRTVERHVTSLYRKIGVARRSEATAFALRHGLA